MNDYENYYVKQQCQGYLGRLGYPSIPNVVYIGKVQTKVDTKYGRVMSFVLVAKESRETVRADAEAARNSEGNTRQVLQ